MAKQFAKIGMNSKVIEVVTIADDVCLDSTDTHSEAIGQEFLEQTYFWPRQMWIETFKDGTRKNYAAIGYTWDADRNAFITPKPSDRPSWVLDETTCTYKAPVAVPSTLTYTKDSETYKYKLGWDEDNGKWIGQRLEDDPVSNWNWNTSTSSWDAA
tara:strand:- start:50 stop:517 length:468 start_codon:yes stop_codon:yes gene_type:complete